MTNEKAIKYLKQLYPNGGHCWLDEQRIEARTWKKLLMLT